MGFPVSLGSDAELLPDATVRAAFFFDVEVFDFNEMASSTELPPNEKSLIVEKCVFEDAPGLISLSRRAFFREAVGEDGGELWRCLVEARLFF